MPAKTIADLRGDSKHVRGCRECGKPAQARVLLTIAGLDPKTGKVGGKGTTVTRTVTLCETHGVSTFENALAAINH